MIDLKGKYNIARVFTDNIDATSQGQIINLLSNEAFANTKIRIMPDVHAGAGCVIGFSMEVADKIVPNLVGVDIGCGVLTVVLDDDFVDVHELDKVIKQEIPSGFSIHEDINEYREYTSSFLNLYSTTVETNVNRAKHSIGTLGGGNHFIELGATSRGQYMLFIHTGSRNFGLQIAQAHQKIAKKETGLGDLSYLEGRLKDNYLHDMKIAQKYAAENRVAIANTIISEMKLNPKEMFDTVHNYIDMKDQVLRKGAVSARKDEKLVIPLNMRDGVIIAKGKGNPDWNNTAPHGAGRLYSRSQAKKEFNLEDFKQEMEEVYSTSVNESTLDESPMAYKSATEILQNIKDTVEVIEVVKPIYNYKA
ncbi:MAG: RtcB family protein [Candidatus Woesearchaeota archaeon]